MLPKTRRLLCGPNYAALATIRPDGSPSCHMMWIGCDDEYVYLNTEIARRKFRDMQIGASVAVLVFETSRSWVEIGGTVVEHILGERARAHLEALSQKYNNKPYAKRIDSPRVIVKIRPDREFEYVPSTGYGSGRAGPSS